MRTVACLDAWPALLQGQLPSGVVAAASWLPAPDSFERLLLGDLSQQVQQFGGCSFAGACHMTPPSR